MEFELDSHLSLYILVRPSRTSSALVHETKRKQNAKIQATKNNLKPKDDLPQRFLDYPLVKNSSINVPRQMKVVAAIAETKSPAKEVTSPEISMSEKSCSDIDKNKISVSEQLNLVRKKIDA